MSQYNFLCPDCMKQFTLEMSEQEMKEETAGGYLL